jgi:hypothetical protein
MHRRYNTTLEAECYGQAKVALESTDSLWTRICDTFNIDRTNHVFPIAKKLISYAGLALGNPETMQFTAEKQQGLIETGFSG